VSVIAAQVRGIHADGGPGALGQASYNPPAVGSIPTRPTCSYKDRLGKAVNPDAVTECNEQSVINWLQFAHIADSERLTAASAGRVAAHGLSGSAVDG
jgi:hypothetical protein